MKYLYLHSKSLDLINSEKELQNSVISVSSLCQALAELKNEVTLALPIIASSNDNTASEWAQTNLNIKPLFNYCNIEYNTEDCKLKKLFVPSKIKSIIRSINPEIVITRNVAWAIASSKAGFRTIIDLHSPHISRNKLFDIYSSIRLRNAYKGNNNIRFIAISENLIKKWINTFIKPSDIVLARNGFDPNMYAAADKIKYREELCLEKEEKYILYAGSLYGHRDIDIVIKVAQELPKYKFFIIGGPERHKAILREKILSLRVDNVFLMSSMDKVHLSKYIQSADVLLAVFSDKLVTADYFSSLKIIEFMASGVPVVTQDYKAVLEIIQDKKNGYISKKNCVMSLVNKIEEAVLDPKSKNVGINAMQYAYDNLTWRHRAAIIDKLAITMQ